MKIGTQKRNTKAFTLIEMIGVLAVIAILAAVLIPKVFEAINNSRINNAAMGCQAAKTALVDHYAKYGGILADGRTTPPTALTAPVVAFDQILLAEQLVDKRFATKIAGTTNHVDLLPAPTSTGGSVVATDGSFALSGNTTNDISGTVTAVAVIQNVAVNDARDLSARIDGDAMSQAVGSTANDLQGRVKYATATTGSGVDVYVYLTHR